MSDRSDPHAADRPSEGSPSPGRHAVSEDPTYSRLRERERVVMRHNIALHLDAFAPASKAFRPRSSRRHPPLQPHRPPFFSVIVPNYNGGRHLPDLLEALARQRFQDFELVFVDDASQDDSVAQVEAFGGRPDAPRTRILVHRSNRGFVASANLGADVAEGRVLALLNNDTAPDPEWLAALARAVCAHPEAGLFASKLVLFDEPHRLHTTGDLLGRDGLPRNRGVWEWDRGQYDRELAVFGACGGAMAVRREVWQALGGFDEDLWMYLEDVDLSFRAQLLGWSTVYVPDARVRHRLGSSGGDELSSYYVGRNTIWVLAKNMPARLLVRHLPAIVGGQLRIAWEALRHLRGRAARARLRGQLAGLLGVPRMLAKRRQIQARRLRPDEEIERLLVD